jgi:hypothetical protein
MTNLEWLRSLSGDELSDIILGSRCNLCVYQQSEECPTNKEGRYDCRGGFYRWCNAEHVPEVKPCPCCGGKAEIIEIEPMIQYVSCTQCIMQTNTGRKNEVIKAWNRRTGNDT